MRSAGVGWSDIGNMIEDGAGDDGKYTESEMLEFAQAAREEGVQAGIKIGEVRASAKGAGNGHLMLPKPAEMAEFCHARLGQLKDDKQRDFVRDMYRITVLRRTLSPKQLAWLSSIYIQIGGKT